MEDETLTKIYIRLPYRHLTVKQRNELKLQHKRKGYTFVAIQGPYMVFEAITAGLNTNFGVITPTL